ncbi:hypothetical protein Mapa_004138 [Marchantia paleacea]|nr:hypothetical protein Mapa_004138 [Marchantia paleacea]
MTNVKVLIFSLVANLVISMSVRLVHGDADFTVEDVQLILGQEAMNPGLVSPEGNTPIGQLYAVGLSIILAMETAWVLKNATPVLINAHWQYVGDHYHLPHKDSIGGQPTWDRAGRKSLTIGRPMFVQTQQKAIAWVLLNTTNSEGEPSIFGEVTFIQRLYTKDGLPPTSAPNVVNTTHSSPYSALYVYDKHL